jgi:hypothetical protein
VIVFYVPETRGRTLEEIEIEMREGSVVRASNRGRSAAGEDNAGFTASRK